MLVPLSQEEEISSPRTTIVQSPRPPFTNGSERLVEMREQRLQKGKVPHVLRRLRSGDAALFNRTRSLICTSVHE